jgi:hypothetical protein
MPAVAMPVLGQGLKRRAAYHAPCVEDAAINPDAYGTSSTPASYVVSPYTLVVTQ